MASKSYQTRFWMWIVWLLFVSWIVKSGAAHKSINGNTSELCSGLTNVCWGVRTVNQHTARQEAFILACRQKMPRGFRAQKTVRKRVLKNQLSENCNSVSHMKLWIVWSASGHVHQLSTSPKFDLICTSSKIRDTFKKIKTSHPVSTKQYESHYVPDVTEACYY